MKGLICGVTLCCLLVTTAAAVRAEEGEGASGTLARQKLNPLAYGINLPVTLSFGVGPHRDPQPTLTLQPRIPLGLTEDWRLVTRSNVSIIHMPEPEETTGLGDIDVSLFLTPARTGTWVFGAGPILQFPTATDTALGTGKWSAGPTAALVYVGGPWVNGILMSHLWSFAGPDSRAAVSLTQIEAQVSYSFPDDWYIDTNPTISYDWNAPRGERWLIPIGVDVGRAFKIGSQAMSLQLGAYYNVKKPASATEWVVQTQLSWSY